MNLFRFIPGYESSIFDVGREPAFLMLLTFIVTEEGVFTPGDIAQLVDRTPFLREGYALLMPTTAL